MTEAPVLAVTAWKSNAELIVDVARLGYLNEDWSTLDPTYGRGTWWKLWRPANLVASDLNPKLSPTGTSVDFTALPHDAGSFLSVAFDPPYKLNGRPDPAEERYGVHETTSREGRHQLMTVGQTECARVLAPGGYLLTKCMNQVNSGRVWWQTEMMTKHAEGLGLEKVDEFHYLGGRPQPEDRTRMGCPSCAGRLTKVKAGRKCREHGVVEPVDVPVDQEHARRNHSTLLVFRKC